jgi:hypothetical protein
MPPEITIRAIAPSETTTPRRPRLPLRRRPLRDLADELQTTLALRDAHLEIGALSRAAELGEEAERLTRAYVARRDAPPVTPPSYLW